MSVWYVLIVCQFVQWILTQFVYPAGSLEPSISDIVEHIMGLALDWWLQMPLSQAVLHHRGRLNTEHQVVIVYMNKH